MNRDKDLTDALELLLKRNADDAVAKATLHSDEWVAKCIIYIARAFFLFDFMAAIKTFGGVEEFKQMMLSERIERYFIVGHVALFKEEKKEAESAFEFAAKIAPEDPFVRFSLGFTYLKHGKLDKTFEIVSQMACTNSGHPLLSLLVGAMLHQKNT